MRKTWVIIPLSLLIMIVAASGCGEKKAASVNGVPIYLKDLDKRVNAITKDVGRELTDLEKQTLEQRRQQILTDLIRMEVISQGAKNFGIKLDKKKIDQEYKRRMEKYPGPGAFKKQLEIKGINEKDFRNSIENDMLVNAIKKKLLKKVAEPNEDTLRKYYENNRNYFIQPEQIHVRDFPLKESDMPAAQKEVEQGVPFVDIAKKYSLDESTKAQGGDLGFFSRGTFGAEFENFVFGMARKRGAVAMTKINDIPHIIEFMEWRELKQLSFEESKVQVRGALKYEETNKLFSNWYADVAKRAKVKKYI